MKKLTIISLTLLALLLAACAPGRATAQPTPTAFPVDWAALGLEGSLLYVRYQPEGNAVVRMDLSSGERVTLYQSPPKGVISAAQVSPDGRSVVLPYSPPPTGGESFVFPSLWLFSLDEPGKLTALTPGPNPDDSYYDPTWAADGQSVFCTHFWRDENGEAHYAVARVSLDGQVTNFMEDAVWPRASADGRWLAYLTIDYTTGTNQLRILDLASQETTAPVADDAFQTVDAPVFSPDSQTILFSAPVPALATADSRATADNRAAADSWETMRSWLDRLFGVTVAQAHSVPSDWYRAPVSGGEPVRLTEQREAGLNGDFSPDGAYLAYISESGIYIMQPDGSARTQISKELVVGTLDWLPD